MLIDSQSLIGVVGAGAMGSGIAQVAARAGHRVSLFDVSSEALDQAQRRLAANLGGLVAKGKLTSDAAKATIARIEPVNDLRAAQAAGLVVEAVTEDLAVKRDVFQRLETIVADGCVLASNTSCLSITSLARGLRLPERVIGMHFFNPVPQMKLVEVVSGLQTKEATVEAVFELVENWGKVPIRALSTPGFIVNRIARPFYGEALLLLQQRAAEPAVIDACLRGAGFRMGPCELMDLIGHDVNLAVTEAIFEAMCGDERFVPSPLQRELVAAGYLGRKSGRGFFDYRGGGTPTPSLAATSAPEPPPADRVVLRGRGAFVDRSAAVLARAGRRFERDPESGWTGLSAGGSELRMTDGRAAGLVALQEDVTDLALFDLTLSELMAEPEDMAEAGRMAEPGALAWTAARSATPEWQRATADWIRAAGWVPHRVSDTPGLIVARTVAAIINEAADAVLHGAATADAVDVAMKLAVNYPAGPFEWLQRWDVCDVVQLLDDVHEQARGARYRVSLELRQRAWSCEGGRHRGRRRVGAS